MAHNHFKQMSHEIVNISYSSGLLVCVCVCVCVCDVNPTKVPENWMCVDCVIILLAFTMKVELIVLINTRWVCPNIWRHNGWNSHWSAGTTTRSLKPSYVHQWERRLSMYYHVYLLFAFLLLFLWPMSETWLNCAKTAVFGHYVLSGCKNYIASSVCVCR